MVELFRLLNIGIVLVAVILGALVWNDAKTHNYNSVFWGVITILFFPLGCVAYILYRIRGKNL